MNLFDSASKYPIVLFQTAQNEEMKALGKASKYPVVLFGTAAAAVALWALTFIGAPETFSQPPKLLSLAPPLPQFKFEASPLELMMESAREVIQPSWPVARYFDPKYFYKREIKVNSSIDPFNRVAFSNAMQHLKGTAFSWQNMSITGQVVLQNDSFQPFLEKKLSLENQQERLSVDDLKHDLDQETAPSNAAYLVTAAKTAVLITLSGLILKQAPSGLQSLAILTKALIEDIGTIADEINPFAIDINLTGAIKDFIEKSIIACIFS